MSATAILAQLKAAGVRISRRGDNLLAEPKAAVTEPLLVLMRTHKGELLAALSEEPADTVPSIRHPGELAEIRAFVAAVTAFNKLTPDQTAEAHRQAQADPVRALECFRILAGLIPRPSGAEARQERLQAMLERDPGARYAVLTTNDGKGSVIVSIAIRGVAMADFQIERDRYDGVLLLELMEKHTVH